jgi:putative oxidoreductase
LQSFLGLEEVMYLAIFVWLAIAGPGKVSVDRWLEGRGKS